MRKSIIILMVFINFNIFSININLSLIQAYGEGPIRRHLIGFDVIEYSEEDAIKLAQDEIFEFLSGMIYGYNFVYKVENKLDHTKGYFDLVPVLKIQKNDKNLKLGQINDNKTTISIQAIYSLLPDQKNYIAGYQSSLAKLCYGEARGEIFQAWPTRLDIYKLALRNAVLNEAKGRLKARPLYIKGKLLLNKNPVIGVISGDWTVKVEAHIIIKEISYLDVY